MARIRGGKGRDMVTPALAGVIAQTTHARGAGETASSPQAPGDPEHRAQALVVISADSTIESCNPSFLRILGLENGGLAGASVSVLFPDESRAARFLAALNEQLGQRDTAVGSVELRRPAGGEPVQVAYQASALQTGGTDAAGSKRAGQRIAVLVDALGQDAREGEARAFSRFSDESPFPVLRVSLEGILLNANRGSWLLLEHWGTQPGDPVPAGWKKIIEEAALLRDGREVEVQIGFKTLLLVIVPVIDKGYVNIFGLDVTSRKQAEKRLLIDSQVFESASEAVVITDADRRILDVNRAFTAITGYSREEILGENIGVLSSGRHDAIFYEDMWECVRQQGSWQGEVWDRRKNGEVFPKWVSISAVKDEAGRISRFIGLFSDISVMKQTQEQLYEMAHYDSLTGLPNRRYFLDRLRDSIEQGRRTREGLALMFVDLDSFKMVNDNLGHRAGDQLLREVAARIRQCVRESDTVARMGGDEFTVILSQVRTSDSAVIVARKILQRIYEPVELDQKEFFVSSSIGIAVFPDDAQDVEGLLQSADTALYKAKDLGKNGYQFFSREMNRRAVERLTLQTQIRQGIAAREFIVYYQPQVDAASGALVGLEALARWQSPQIGIVSPEQFIPLAEETGLIHELGQLILRAACAQGKRWIDDGIRPMRIGVNISAHQLRRADFVDVIQGGLRDTGFPPQFLELELTESMLIDDVPEDLEKLKRIKAMGIHLSIDDFGTKYSSFAYLRRLPIDRLKIDRSFVQDLPGDERGAEIVSAIIAMSRSLNLEVVAEGVETRVQAALLTEKGCGTLQGYFCGRPFPPESLAAFLAHGQGGGGPMIPGRGQGS